MPLLNKKPSKPSDDSKKDLSIAMEIQRKNKKKKTMAEGGDVGGAETSTSTTGNKTKTGGSNPGGASTGGAGTVTITTGQNPPQSINASRVGGKTDAQNSGGMDPSDQDDDMMKGSERPSPEAMDAMKQHLANGGFVTDWIDGYARSADDQNMDMPLDMLGDAPRSHESELDANDERPSSVTAAIMKRKKFAEGGIVDLSDNARESANTMDRLNFEALRKENYSEQAGLDELDYDTDESIGRDIESDKHNMVSAIRAKVKYKQRS